MKKFTMRFLIVVLIAVGFVLLLIIIGFTWSSWNTAPKTFRLDGSELYVKVERLNGSDTIRFYFNNSYDNTGENYIDVIQPHSNWPALEIYMVPIIPNNIYISNSGKIVKKVVSKDYNIIIPELTEISVGVGRNRYEWSDSTLYKTMYIRYSHIPYARGFKIYNKIDNDYGDASLAFKMFGHVFHIRI